MTEVLNLHWVGGKKPIGMLEATENAHSILALDLHITLNPNYTPSAPRASPRALTLDFLGNSGLMGGCGEGDDALGMVGSKLLNESSVLDKVLS